jgi:hypothetical protein
MPGSKYHKQFDPEYKREMVRLVEELGKSPAEAGQGYLELYLWSLPVCSGFLSRLRLARK